ATFGNGARIGMAPTRERASLIPKGRFRARIVFYVAAVGRTTPTCAVPLAGFSTIPPPLTRPTGSVWFWLRLHTDFNHFAELGNQQSEIALSRGQARICDRLQCPI